MAVTVYKSTDASAPTLSGTAGDLAAVLDACLVNGYGAKAAAGWGISFTAANKRVYRAALGNGNRFFLRLDDTGSVVAANFSLFRAYETMSDIDTGINPFPNTAQLANGCSWQKSNAVSAAVRPWIVIATPTIFYLFMDYSANGSYLAYVFGDFVSYKTNDIYSVIISADYNSICFATALSGSSNRYNLPYVARKFDGIGVSLYNCIYLVPMNGLCVPSGGFTWSWGGGAIIGGVYSPYGASSPSARLGYPDPVSNRIFFSPFYIIEYNTSDLQYCVRGWLPGLWTHAYSNSYLPSGGIINGTVGTLTEGKTFEIIPILSAVVGVYGQFVMETSDTWLSTTFF